MGLIVEKIITKSFARLMGRGIHRGFITYEELFKSLGYDLERNYFLRTKLSASREFFILLGLFFSLGKNLYSKLRCLSSVR